MAKIFFAKDEWYMSFPKDEKDEEYTSDISLVEIPDELWNSYQKAFDKFEEFLNKVREYDPERKQ